MRVCGLKMCLLHPADLDTSGDMWPEHRRLIQDHPSPQLSPSTPAQPPGHPIIAPRQLCSPVPPVFSINSHRQLLLPSEVACDHLWALVPGHSQPIPGTGNWEKGTSARKDPSSAGQAEDGGETLTFSQSPTTTKTPVVISG